MSNLHHSNLSTPDAGREARPPTARAWLWAFLAVGTAFALRTAFDPFWGDRLAYAWFFLAVVALAFFTRVWPQVFVATAGLLLGTVFFVQPRFSLRIQDPVDRMNALLYVAVCWVVLYFSARARRAATRELSARDRIAQILTCTSDAVCTLDREWRITYFNRQAAELARLNSGNVLGCNFWEVWPDLIDTRFECEYRNVMEQRQPVQFEEYDQLRERWIEVHAAPYGEGIVVFFRNVDSRKRAEASRAQLAAIVESSDDAIIGVSKAGSVVTWNSAAELLFGHAPSRIIGRPVSTLFESCAAKTIADTMEKVRQGERVSHFETKQLRNDGCLVDVSLTISPVAKSDQQNVCISIISRDISERKRAEAERERLIGELREAMAQVKTLSGLLPICAQCKKIRDEKGAWRQIELYIKERSNANFTHGICPECARRLYPNFT